MDKMTEKERQGIHLQLGKFLFGCNLPFRVVENPEFLEFVRLLRPAYQPPRKREVGDAILDRVYDTIEDKLTNAIKGEEVVLMQDGWSTNQQQPIIAHSLQCGKEVHFFNALNTGTNSKTAEYCYTLLDTAIKDVEAKHGCKVIGVVTDNCNVMKSLRSIISNRRPEVIAYGCTSHYLNSVGRKITPAAKIEDVIKVQRYFKSHHHASAALAERNGNRPVLPGSTRWNSQMDCLENFKQNHANYLAIARQFPEKFDPEILQLIKSSSIYDDAEGCLQQAKPVAVSLDKVRS